MGGRSGSPRLVPAVTAAVADASTDLDGSLCTQAVESSTPTCKHTRRPSLSSLSVEERPASAHCAPLVNLQRRAHLNYPFPAPSGQPAAPGPGLAAMPRLTQANHHLSANDGAEGEE